MFDASTVSIGKDICNKNKVNFEPTTRDYCIYLFKKNAELNASSHLSKNFYEKLFKVLKRESTGCQTEEENQFQSETAIIYCREHCPREFRAGSSKESDFRLCMKLSQIPALSHVSAYVMLSKVISPLNKESLADQFWTQAEDDFVRSRIQYEDQASLNFAATAECLQGNQLLKMFSLQKIRHKVRIMSNRLAVARGLEAEMMYGPDQEWHEHHEELFERTCQKIKLDLKRSTLADWAARLCRFMKGEIYYKDIFARLRLMHMDLQALVDVRSEDEESDDEDGDEINKDDLHNTEPINEQNPRLSLYEAKSKFNLVKQEGPVTKCGCCGKLDFKPRMHPYTLNVHARVSTMPVLASKLSYMLEHPSQAILCSACYLSVCDHKTPTFCCGQSSPFRIMAPEISQLTDFEAYFVSLSIAFGRIRSLPVQRQQGIKGGMVCVPVVTDVTKQLPRTFDECEVVHVDLKRKLEFKHYHRSGNLRPAAIFDALAVLKTKSLYESQNIVYRNQADFQQEVNDVQAAEASQRQEQTNATAIANLPTTNIASSAPHENSPVIAAVENPGAAAYVDADGFQVSADYEGCYADESCVTAGTMPTVTCMVPQQTANEMRQKVLALAPSEGGHPMRLFQDRYGEEQCFPKLFGGQPRPDTYVSQFRIFKHELCNADRRFASSMENIFFKHTKHELLSVFRSSHLSLRKAVQGKVTAKDLLDPLTADYLCAHDLGYSNLKLLRSSPDYKQFCKRDLFAMIRQLGCPAFFLTVSSADTRWHELINMLSVVAGNGPVSQETCNQMNYTQKSQMIVKDPVTCARYYDHRIEAFLKGMVKGSDVLGNVTDYAGIDEFQARGAPHTHTMVWNEDAPRYGKDPDADVIAFYDKYITTDSSLVRPELADLQRHAHSTRCGGKKESGACSFGFPRPPMPYTVILKPLQEDEISAEEKKVAETNYKFILNAMRNLNNNIAGQYYDPIIRALTPTTMGFIDALNLTMEQYLLAIRTSIKRVTFFFKRTPIDLMINPFNVHILEVWQANMDLQPVTEAYQTAMYIASYIMKTAKGMSNLLKKVQSEDYPNTAAYMRNMGKTCINSSETCAQEAVYTILGLHLRRFSRAVEFIATQTSDARFKIAKSKKQLMELAEDDRDNIFSKGAVDRYGERPDDMKDLCLADFVANYEYKRDPRTKQLGYFKRKMPKVIRYVSYSRTTAFEDFCREHVMLYSPWHGQLDDPPEDNSWEKCFQIRADIIAQNQKKYSKFKEEDWQAMMAEAFAAMQELADVEGVASEGERSGNEGPTTRDVLEQNDNRNTSISLTCDKTRFVQPEHFSNKVANLNLKQGLYFKNFLYNHTKHPEVAQRQFLTGGAGVGKSVLIDTITQAVTEFHNHNVNCHADTLRVILAAPTGKAAYNIAGRTVHSIFSLPVRSQFKTLSDMKEQEFQLLFGPVKLIIIDEISMLSNKQLHMIDQRVRSFKRNQYEFFGGLSVIFVGDLFQLPPIGAKSIFVTDGIKTNYWRAMFDMYELTEIMRQKGDKVFAEALNRIREGQQTTADLQLLRTRVLPRQPGIPYIFAYHKPKDAFAQTVVEGNPNELFVFEGKDKLYGEFSAAARAQAEQHISNLKSKGSGRLVKTLKLKIGLPVVLLQNIDVSDGLFNGSTGILKAVTTCDRKTVLWIKFDADAVGRKYRGTPANRILAEKQNATNNLTRFKWTPIEKVALDYQENGEPTGPGGYNKYFQRCQFPVDLACAITVHYSQGSTYKEAGTDYEKASPTLHLNNGQAYTGYSRVTSLEGLFLMQLDPADIRCSGDVVKEMKRLRTERIIKFDCPEFDASKATLSLYVHNVRSFRKHKLSILKSAEFRTAPICFLQETHCALEDSVAESYPNAKVLEIKGSTSVAGVAFVVQNIDTHRVRHVNAIPSPQDSRILILHLIVEIRGIVFSIIGLYCPPRETVQKIMQAIDLVRTSDCEFLSTYSGTVHTVIVGDFNVDLDSDDQRSENLTAQMQGLELKNIHSEPTRTTNSSNTRIDHVWHSDLVSGTLDVGYCQFSDHSPLFAYLSPVDSMAEDADML